jgi:hypothetical protein
MSKFLNTGISLMLAFGVAGCTQTITFTDAEPNEAHCNIIRMDGKSAAVYTGGDHKTVLFTLQNGVPSERGVSGQGWDHTNNRPVDRMTINESAETCEITRGYQTETINYPLKPVIYMH